MEHLSAARETLDLLTKAPWALALASIRMFSCFMFFFPLAAFLGTSLFLRLPISLAMSIPVLHFQFDDVVQVLDLKILDLLIIAFSEIAIGFAIAIIFSIPFYYCRLAGGVIDNYRADQQSKEMEESGETVGSYGALLTVICMFAFLFSGGFPLIYMTVVNSYAAMPLFEVIILENYVDLHGILQQADAITEFGVLLAAPVIILVMAAEFTIVMTSKFYKKLRGIDSGQMGVKNIVALLIMPIYLIFATRFMLNVATGFPFEGVFSGV